MKGFFFGYRGNFYGPFNDKHKAETELSSKRSEDTWEMKNLTDPGHVFFAEVEVKDKRLISIK